MCDAVMRYGNSSPKYGYGIPLKYDFDLRLGAVWRRQTDDVCPLERILFREDFLCPRSSGPLKFLETCSGDMLGFDPIVPAEGTHIYPGLLPRNFRNAKVTKNKDAKVDDVIDEA